MSNLIQEIVSEQNLYWAWEKAKGYLQTMENYYDIIGLSEFEADLNNELNKIANKVKTGNYVLSPIIPIPRPKKAKKKKPVLRQFFDVDIRDQILWIAIINIIGPTFEQMMPFWSYGNRLNVPVYKDDNGNWHYGWYRYGSKNIYAKWFRAWGLYQKSIAITIKIMQNINKFRKDDNEFVLNSLEQQEIELFNENKSSLDHLQIKYFDKGYWNHSLSGDVYWAGIDFKSFYPSLNMAFLEKQICSYYQDNDFLALIHKMLDFKVDYSMYTKDEWKQFSIKLGRGGQYKGLPTGLFVGGFLANVYLLEIDTLVEGQLLANKNIAHFRFVDDHIIMADDFNEMIEWVKNYILLIDKFGNGIRLNPEKTSSEGLKKIITGKISEKVYEQAKQECKLDRDFPKPFMTQTLQKMYFISNSELEFETLEESEKNIADLLQMLSTEIPEEEVREETKTSFLANQIAKQGTVYLENGYRTVTIDQLRDMLLRIENKNQAVTLIEKKIELEQQACLQKLLENQNRNCTDIESLVKQREQLKTEIEQLRKELRKEVTQIPELKYSSPILSKYLLKAIDDNYEKVNLWRSYWSFVRKSGIGKPEILLSQLEKINNDKTRFHDLSVPYILTYILTCVIMELHSSFWVICSEDFSIREKRVSLDAIVNMTDIEIINILARDVRFQFHSEIVNSYFTLIWVLHEVVGNMQGKLQDAFNNIGINGDLLKRFEVNYQKLIKKYPQFTEKISIADKSKTLWSLIKNHADYFEKKFYLIDKIYKELSTSFFEMDCSNSSRALMVLYPSNVPYPYFEHGGNVFASIEKLCGQGWTLDWLGGKNISEIEALPPSIKKHLGTATSHNGFDNLNVFITKLQSLIDDKKRGLLEYVSINIVLSIIQSLNNFDISERYPMSTDKPLYRYINTYNLFINSNVICDILKKETTSKNFINQFLEIDESIKIEYQYINDPIYDQRYNLMVSGVIDPENVQAAIRYSLITIFIQLLTLRGTLPSKSNFQIIDKTRRGNIQYLLEEVPISSTSQIIIRESFSKMSEEKLVALNLQKGLFVESQVENKLQIFELNELEYAFKEALRNLKDNLFIDALSIRQAIPIDLEQISSFESVYVRKEGEGIDE